MDSWQTRLSALNMVDSYPSMQAIYICKQTLSQRFCWVCLLELLQATHLLHSSICLWKEIHFEKITCRKCFYITLILLCQLNVIISQLFLFAIHKESILWPGENVCAICTAMKSVTADVCKTFTSLSKTYPKMPATNSITDRKASKTRCCNSTQITSTRLTAIYQGTVLLFCVQGKWLLFTVNNCCEYNGVQLTQILITQNIEERKHVF